MSTPPPRKSPARWRKSKGGWGKWELWRGEAWLARIVEVRLRSGDTKYLWFLVAREECGQADTLKDARSTARTAMEHAEIKDSLRELEAEAEALS